MPPRLEDATLRQLQIFAAAAEHLSFSRAARAVHVSQPAVSMQMGRLAELAGQPLFERLGRRLYLTGAGETLLKHAHEVLSVLEDAGDELQALSGIGAGRIRIGVTSTAKYFAPRLIARFLEQHPAVELRLAVNNREAVDAMLAANEVDLAIMGRPPERLDTDVAAFADHPLVVIAPPGHALAGRARVPLARIAEEGFVVRERGSGTRAAMERFFGEHGLEVRIAMEMSSNETIKQAVMAGLGLGFISRHTIGLELAAGVLATVSAPGLPVVRTWNVVRLREKRLSPVAAAFEQFVVAEGRRFLAGF